MGKTSHPDFNRSDFNKDVWGNDNGKYKDTENGGTTTFTVNAFGNPQINHYNDYPDGKHDHAYHDMTTGETNVIPPH